MLLVIARGKRQYMGGQVLKLFRTIQGAEGRHIAEAMGNGIGNDLRIPQAAQVGTPVETAAPMVPMTDLAGEKNGTAFFTKRQKAFFFRVSKNNV